MRLPQLRRREFKTSGTYPRKMPARTLYELLGVRPDSDAKTLHDAFRDAAKVHHPDRNPGDPDATMRFTRIVNAYGILRNAEQRGVYDEMLARERERRRAELTHAIGSNVFAMVALIIVISGGYTLFLHASKISIEAAKVADVTARRLADISAVQSTKRAASTNRDQPSERVSEAPQIVAVPKAQTSGANTGSPAAIADRGPVEIDAAEPAASASPRDEPGDKSTGVERADAPAAPSAVAPDEKSHEAPTMAKDDSPPGPTESNSEVAKAVDALVAAVDRGDMEQSNAGVAKAVDALVAAVDRGDMGSVADQKKNDESHPLDQTRVGSLEPRSSPSEKDKSSSSDLATLEEKRDARTKARPRAQVKRPMTDRTLVRQAAVEGGDMSRAVPESRGTPRCAGSCSDRAPPLFGVGF